jgi:hypothetical protein
MNNNILIFLEVYKNLDELCKHILSSDIGVSKYIEDMEKEIQGSFYVTDWEKDYKKLKHIRWIRNQLVHDTNSFENNIVTTDDIEWLKEFQTRIIKCTDPFSLLNQMRNQSDTIKNVNSILSQTINHNNSKNNKKSNNGALVVVIIITIVLLVSMFVIPILFSTFNYLGNYSYEETKIDNTQNEVNFETLVFSGEKSATIKNIHVPNGNYYIIGKYYGDGNFVAELHKSVKDNFGQLIANKIGECESIYGFQGPIENGYINVESASGKWEFTIIACEIISEENLRERYTYTGSGAKVIPNINLPKGEYYITCTYKGDRNFGVTFYNSINNNFGELIANEIGDSEVTYGIQGPIRHGYIDIDMANGDWTITIEPCNN